MTPRALAYFNGQLTTGVTRPIKLRTPNQLYKLGPSSVYLGGEITGCLNDETLSTPLLKAGNQLCPKICEVVRLKTIKNLNFQMNVKSVKNNTLFWGENIKLVQIYFIKQFQWGVVILNFHLFNFETATSTIY
jgi:hypothetical protein